MSLPDSIQREIERRAAGRCEYCRMHQSLQGATFHAEHIVPRRHGGNSDLQNLALACPGCNLHKSDRVDSIDPVDGALVHLFHPRRDRWTDYFRWEEYEIAPVTAIGRATMAALHFNEGRRIQIRQAEELFNLFPPDDG